MFSSLFDDVTMSCTCAYTREIGLLKFSQCSDTVLDSSYEELVGPVWAGQIDKFVRIDVAFAISSLVFMILVLSLVY